MKRIASVAFALASLLAPLPSHAATVVHLQANLGRFCDASALLCTLDDSPHVTTIAAGDSVDWVHNDRGCDALMSCAHNVTFADREGGPTLKGDALDLLSPQRPMLFSRTFTTPGTYQYWCSAHKVIAMTGTIVVTA